MDYVVFQKIMKEGLTVGKGMIGIFNCGKDGTKLCSVSLRSSENGKELEKAVQDEHPDVNLELVKAYSFECIGEIVEVEKKLRKLLVQVFDKYTPSFNDWECYKVNCEKVVSLIGSVLSLCKTVTDFNEQTV